MFSIKGILASESLVSSVGFVASEAKVDELVLVFSFSWFVVFISFVKRGFNVELEVFNASSSCGSSDVSFCVIVRGRPILL